MKTNIIIHTLVVGLSLNSLASDSCRRLFMSISNSTPASQSELIAKMRAQQAKMISQRNEGLAARNPEDYVDKKTNYRLQEISKRYPEASEVSKLMSTIYKLGPASQKGNDLFHEFLKKNENKPELIQFAVIEFVSLNTSLLQYSNFKEYIKKFSENEFYSFILKKTMSHSEFNDAKENLIRIIVVNSRHLFLEKWRYIGFDFSIYKLPFSNVVKPPNHEFTDFAFISREEIIKEMESLSSKPSDYFVQFRLNSLKLALKLKDSTNFSDIFSLNNLPIPYFSKSDTKTDSEYASDISNFITAYLRLHSDQFIQIKDHELAGFKNPLEVSRDAIAEYNHLGQKKYFLGEVNEGYIVLTPKQYNEAVIKDEQTKARNKQIISQYRIEFFENLKLQMLKQYVAFLESDMHTSRSTIEEFKMLIKKLDKYSM